MSRPYSISVYCFFKPAGKIILASSLSFLLTATAPKVQCQNTLLRSFTTKEGLAHNNVRAIARDSTGFLWIGTWDGLSRYDGYEFKNYYHKPGDTTSIPYFSVYNLAIDGANNLWVLTDSRQIAIYNRLQDNFQILKRFGDSHSGKVDNICSDDSGNLWIVCRDALFRKSPADDELTKYIIIYGNNERAELPGNSYKVTLGNNNKVWLSGNSVTELVLKGKNATIIKNYKIEGPVNEIATDFELVRWTEFFESADGNKWLFSNTGLYKFNPDSEIFEEYTDIINLKGLTGKKNRLWGMWRGGTLHVLNSQKQTFTKHNPATDIFLAAIYPQDDNIIWYSGITKTGEPLGIQQLVFTSQYFNNYLIGNDKKKTTAVFSILKTTDNNLFIGTQGNNYILHYSDELVRKTGELSHDLFNSSGHIRQMIEAPQGMWIGYLNNLLIFYDKEKASFTRYSANVNSYRTLCLTPEGKLFIGTKKLIMFDPETGNTKEVWECSENALFYDLLLTSEGILWGSLANSLLLRYDTNNGKQDLFRITSELYHIEDICEEGDGTLWLALLGGGLCSFNPKTGESIIYTTSNGLCNNTVYSILKDKSGNLWISTNSGISRFNPDSKQFRTFSEVDGLKISEFNSDASFSTKDGEFFFGGMGGFVSFYPDSINLKDNSKTELELLITELEVSGETKYFQEDINSSDTLIFGRGENNFHISFTTSDLVNSDKIYYRYRLTDIDDEWIETDSHNRNINYANLKPGWYKLSIQARDINGNWTSARSYSIRITPYFYQTRIFLLMLPLLILSLISFSIVNYIRQFKQKERLKQDELKLQSLRGQMNPHFIFNSLNSINYFISNNDRLSANRYIADFSSLIRTILSNLGKNFIPFQTEIESLTNYLDIEHLRFGDKFDFEIITSEIGEFSQLEVLPGLVQPFIENSIWHGVKALEKRKGKISIRFLPTGNDRIKCIIEDDGIGRRLSENMHNPIEHHKSKGIEIVTERLQLISKIRGTNYKLDIYDLHPERMETGTVVKIELPVKLK